MAKIYNNNKGFLVVEITLEEATKLNFGIHNANPINIILCGSCNKMCEENIYYVACLNEVMCKDCIEDYTKNSPHYIDDDSLEYEINHFNWIAKELGLKNRAYRTPDSKIYLTS